MKPFRPQRSSRKHDLSVNKRLDYEMEKIMQKNIRKFESMIQKSISEQLKSDLHSKSAGFSMKDFGQSSSQLFNGIKNMFN